MITPNRPIEFSDNVNNEQYAADDLNVRDPLFGDSQVNPVCQQI